MTLNTTSNLYQVTDGRTPPQVIATYNPTTHTYASSSNMCDASASALNTAYNSLKTTLSDTASTSATISTPPPFAEVQTEHQNVERLRSSLDLQLSDIYRRQGQISGFNGPDVDATVVASVLWTILAGGLVYYIFVGQRSILRA